LTQVSSGALPPFVGYVLAALLLSGVVVYYMFSNNCFKPRVVQSEEGIGFGMKAKIRGTSGSE
jgi:hypothetical protein